MKKPGRNLRPEIVEGLKIIAARNGRSMEAQLRYMLARWVGERSALVLDCQAIEVTEARNIG